MAVSEVNVSDSFLAEVSWARATILQLNEARMRDRPIGIDPATRQPDELFLAFARRDLLFYPYVRSPGFSVGAVEAYTANVSTILYYIEQERREELRSVSATIQDIQAARDQAQNIGLMSAGGNLDDFASYFALRGLPIDAYYRGKLAVGEASAYDANVARLQAYRTQVHNAIAR